MNMKTKIYKIDRENIDLNKLKEASELIKKDELVAMPTETVYGLAANGLSDLACKKIFKAKNRPNDNPLILHIASIDKIDTLAKDISDRARVIMDKLWPGPMTLIFKKSDIIPSTVTAGGDTVAIRMPEDIIARKFISLCDLPIAAPSANISGRPSPTNAKDVLFDMDGKISAIIDGGSSKIGIESTVIDMSEKTPVILRPGFYTYEFLKTYLDDIKLDDSLVDSSKIPKSPGQKYRHYAPKAKMQVYVGKNAYETIKKVAQEKKKEGYKVGILEFDDVLDQFDEFDNLSLGDRNDLIQMSHNLFTSIRLLDKKNCDIILAEGVEEANLGKSIMNRMKKSASGLVFNV